MQKKDFTAKKIAPPPVTAPATDDKKQGVTPAADGEPLVMPDINNPDIIPEDDEFVTPPYDAPEPGEVP